MADMPLSQLLPARRRRFSRTYRLEYCCLRSPVEFNKQSLSAFALIDRSLCHGRTHKLCTKATEGDCEGHNALAMNNKLHQQLSLHTQGYNQANAAALWSAEAAPGSFRAICPEPNLARNF